MYDCICLEDMMESSWKSQALCDPLRSQPPSHGTPTNPVDNGTSHQTSALGMSGMLVYK